MSASSTQNASQLTREEVKALLVEPLLAQSVVLSSGPRVFDSNGGQPVRVPTIVYPLNAHNGASPIIGGAGGAWISENEEINEQDPTYDEVTLLPSNLRSLKVIHRFSNELARYSVVNIANAVRDSLVRRVALEVDHAFLVGNGQSNTPTGLRFISGTTPQSVSGEWTLDKVHDAVGLALAANANPSVWYMHPDRFVALRKKKATGSGEYFLQPDPQQANSFTLVGIPVKPTTQLPTDTALLVDTSQVAVARDLNTSVTLLSERYAEYDQLAIRVVWRGDIAALNPEAIVVSTGISS